MLRRRWTGWIRQPLPFSRTAKGANEGLEFASRDGEHAGLSRLHPVGVRNAFGSEQRFSSAGAVLLISDPVAHFTFKHVEDFILVMVDMQRRRVPL